MIHQVNHLCRSIVLKSSKILTQIYWNEFICPDHRLNTSQLNDKIGSHRHYDDVIMGPIASQITSLTIVYSTVYSDADQRKHQSSVSLAFVRGIQRGPVNSPHKWPVTRKMFPFHDVIMDVALMTSWHKAVLPVLSDSSICVACGPDSMDG